MPATEIRADIERLGGAIRAFVERERANAEACSLDLYRNPELSGEEVRSAKKLADLARGHGFEVEEGVGGMPTAFKAVKRGAKPGPTVALLSEYDALPGIGHGCGHNFIGTASAFAAFAAGSRAEELAGAIALIGTPAEETMGGKIELLKHGVFDGVDAALMVHPAMESTARIRSLALVPLTVRFHGKSAHYAASPWEGINALDAMIALFTSLDHLRKHLRPHVRICGIISNGGQASNIVPDFAEGKFSVRSTIRAELPELVEKFRRCAEGAALATGCRLEMFEHGHRYDEIRVCDPMADRWEARFAEAGGEIEPNPSLNFGSLDIGNLSHRFPCVHPRVKTAPADFSLHTVAFGDSTISDFGREQLARAIESLARCAVEFLADDAFRAECVASWRAGADGK